MPNTAVQSAFKERYTLPDIETMDDTAEEIRGKQKRVRELCIERDVILLAHHYQRPKSRKSPTRWRTR